MTEEQKLKQTVELGRRARETQQYLEGNPYLREVVDRIKMNLISSMVQLRSNQKEEWSAMKVAYDMAPEAFHYMEMDIQRGEQAAAMLTGEGIQEGGTLL